jgi:hypothetical protein
MGKKEDLLSKIIKDCATEAAKAVGVKHKDFDQKKYLDENNNSYKVGNDVTREWYNNFMSTYATVWKPKLEEQVKSGGISLEDYAKISYEARHHARVFTRDHMQDIPGLEAIRQRDSSMYDTKDGPSFKWLLNKQEEKQKKANGGKPFDPDKAYRAIIDSSTETNWFYNLLGKTGLLSIGSSIQQHSASLYKATRDYVAEAIEAVQMFKVQM